MIMTAMVMPMVTVVMRISSGRLIRCGAFAVLILLIDCFLRGQILRGRSFGKRGCHSHFCLNLLSRFAHAFHNGAKDLNQKRIPLFARTVFENLQSLIMSQLRSIRTFADQSVI